MYFENHDCDYNIILIGRESDISLRVNKREQKIYITILLRETVADQSSHQKKLEAPDAIAVVYKLWNDGELFPVRTLIHLQNDVIEYLQDDILTVSKNEVK
jgi:hypothetical protein